MLVGLLCASFLFLIFFGSGRPAVGPPATDTSAARTRRSLVAALFGGLLAAQLAFAHAIYLRMGWDCGFIVEQAERLAFDRAAFDGSWYFEQFPHNRLLLEAFVVVLEWAASIGVADRYFALVALNVAAVNLALLLLWLTARLILSRRGATAALLLGIVVLGFSPWITVPYSDTLSAWIPIGIVGIHLATRHGKSVCLRIGAWSGMGLLGSVAMAMKPPAALALLAVVASALAPGAMRACRARSVVACAASLLLGFVAGQFVIDGFVQSTIGNAVWPPREDAATPWTHFLMMGVGTVRTDDGRLIGYGTYDVDAYAITSSQETAAEKRAANLAEYERRVEQLGAADYLRFLAKKAFWVLGDGTFFLGGEGGFYRPRDAETGAGSPRLQRWFVNTGETAEYLAYGNLAQGVWLVVLPLFAILAAHGWESALARCGRGIMARAQDGRRAA